MVSSGLSNIMASLDCCVIAPMRSPAIRAGNREILIEIEGGNIMIDTSADVTSLSPWWRHSAILVMIAGFSVLSLVTVLTYTNAPPIPEQATDVTGTVVFTGADIQMGQEVFLKYGLMEHGSLWGHGAYLGPDYSAEYLHRLSEVTLDTIATEKYGKLFAQLSPDERSVVSARTMTEIGRAHV